MKVTLECEGNRVEIETTIVWKPDLARLMDIMADAYIAVMAMKHPSIQLKDKEDK
jgi:hypothetical protein